MWKFIVDVVHDFVSSLQPDVGRGFLHVSNVFLLKSSIKFQGHTGQKNQHFWPELSISGLYLQFKFTNGFEVMLKACRSIGDVPYCFWRSSIKYQGHTGRKISNLNPILSKIARLVAAIKSLRFALFQNTH